MKTWGQIPSPALLFIIKTGLFYPHFIIITHILTMFISGVYSLLSMIFILILKKSVFNKKM